MMISYDDLNKKFERMINRTEYAGYREENPFRRERKMGWEGKEEKERKRIGTHFLLRWVS